MPSKGVQCYSYNGVVGCQIEFSVPGQTLIKTDFKNYTDDHLEVDKSKIPGIFNYSGIFRCRVTQNAVELLNVYVTINSLTGNLEGGNMNALANQTTVLTGSLCISYCFYDSTANHSEFKLPNADQFYVVVASSGSNWMSLVAPPGSQAASKPFSRLVIPSAHDIGMNSLQNADACIQNTPSQFVASLTGGVKVIADISATIPSNMLIGEISNIIQSLAITQKDALETVLALGARYFEFRPAHIPNVIRNLQPIPDVLYFMHGPIPGMAYDQFLAGCVDFLLKNPGEIVVFQQRWDGVPSYCAQATDAELDTAMTNALKAANGNLKVGTLQDMTTLSIDALRMQQKRLIVLKNVSSYSSYTDAGNATLDGNSIVTEFNGMTTAHQAGQAFTNLQCQATASNIKGAVAFSALTANVSNSCLLCTKAVCDSKTMPWIRRNALAKLQAEQLIVIMDDFFDGAICDLARDLSARRLASMWQL
jgi:hypothetical protein